MLDPYSQTVLYFAYIFWGGSIAAYVWFLFAKVIKQPKNELLVLLIALTIAGNLAYII